MNASLYFYFFYFYARFIDVLIITCGMDKIMKKVCAGVRGRENEIELQKERERGRERNREKETERKKGRET